MEFFRWLRGITQVWGSPFLTYSEKVMGYHPIQYLPLDETAGTEFRDLSGNNFTGTAVATLTVGGGTFVDTLPALLMSGNGHVSNFSSGFATKFNGEHGALSLWIRSNVPSADQTIIKCGNAANTAQFSLALNTSNYVVGYWRSGGINYGQQLGFTVQNAWIHIAVVWDETAILFYKGGELQNTFTPRGVWGSNLPESYTTIIGAYSANNEIPFTGQLAHVAYFDYTLTPEAVADLAVVRN